MTAFNNHKWEENMHIYITHTLCDQQNNFFVDMLSHSLVTKFNKKIHAFKVEPRKRDFRQISGPTLKELFNKEIFETITT